MSEGQTFLCYFLHRFLDFRRPEVESLAALSGCPTSGLTWTEPFGEVDASPFWYVTLPSVEVAKSIGARMLLSKGLFEIWGEGSTFDELEAAVRSYPDHLKEPYLGPEMSFKVIVDTYGHKVSYERQVEMIERMAFIPFQGPVRMKNPDQRFWLIIADNKENNGMEQVPYRLYFVREVAVSDRAFMNAYTLRSRRYLGPTSMDNEMALLMCNMGKVSKHQLVFDPYAGTGSILVAAAHYGARVLGGDIDVRVLRDGKCDAGGEAVGVSSNFEQYGLEQPVGLVMMDTHIPMFRRDLEEVFDAIIGDPPYGVRAGGKKSSAKDITIRDRETHIPARDPYTLGECLRDLLDLAARMLTIGGRLVYFLPATPETYDEADIPAHPALTLMHNSEQHLTTRYSRRLITMEKTAKYDAGVARAYHEARGDPTMPIDRIHDIVFERFRDSEGNPIMTDRVFNVKRFRSKQV